jgi:hypothetical protein
MLDSMEHAISDRQCRSTKEPTTGDASCLLSDGLCFGTGNSSGNPVLRMPSNSGAYYAENLSDKLSVALVQ